MNKWILAITLVSVAVLSGCSLLQGVNDSLEYVNEATDYVNKATTFAEEVPALAEQAVSDQDARVQLEERLTQMKADIQNFNELNPPGVAEDVHQTIVGYNTTLEQGIDSYLKSIENGEVNPQLLEEYGILQTVNELSKTLDLLQQIGS
ncbi:DUF6376 family protein [Alkalihalobacillus sp. AL-G]|uniref:DUF6376 family protein n=1 Tax=Alkalihalobacillus sp. AL-G TaxID=2926399 RepID=UPI00272A079F|nr:DUF6376 family protein [Alkalihalobacillus sp. AL-G]WLD92767.1 DUF6376 family protein [Alkalihalobacillus sp. AL-G]